MVVVMQTVISVHNRAYAGKKTYTYNQTYVSITIYIP